MTGDGQIDWSTDDPERVNKGGVPPEAFVLLWVVVLVLAYVLTLAVAALFVVGLL